jgi:hypothetical protein
MATRNRNGIGPPHRSDRLALTGRAASRQDEYARWSVLGPQPKGEPWTTADNGGPQTIAEPAGRHAYSSLTWDGGNGRCGVRVSPPGLLRALRALGNGAVLTEDEPHPPDELYPLPG